MKKFILLFIGIISTQILAQEKRPLTVDDIWAMKRVSNISVSKDGSKVIFSVREYSMELNKGNTDIVMMDSDGSDIEYIVNSSSNENSPRFFPNSNKILYLKNGDLFIFNSATKEETELLNIYSNITSYVLSDDGKRILFTSEVYPDCIDQECVKKKDEEKNKSLVEARVYEDLLFRHWDEWRDEKRSHLFMYEIESNKYYDLSQNVKFDVPTSTLGGDVDFNFSPDGKQAVVAVNTIPNPASNTNNDIYLIDVSKPEAKTFESWVKISESKGSDTSPVFSPDGKSIAFLSMERAGFEADKGRIALYNLKESKINYLTENVDFSFDEIVWSNDSKLIYSSAPDQVNNTIFKINVSDGKVKKIVANNLNREISLNNKSLYYRKQNSRMPYEVYKYDLATSKETRLSYLNEELLSKIEWYPIETFWSVGANKTKIQSILVKPPFFDESKKYPMIFLIHGGPQGHWTDDFHYRWNTQMFAAKGYVVVATNPRGSVGYGQKFTDEISEDWGGKVYEDLMNSYDKAIANYSFIDKNNTFAAGASYGGYMAAWIEGHTDRFNAIVDHDGVFNLESMYGTTEELWFPEWEMGGSYYDNPELYEKWSPINFVKNFKTPMLIIQGGLDFRVPESQAFEFFTALQKMGVESKLLHFPKETHFVLKPQNAKFWWKNVFEWFEKFKR